MRFLATGEEMQKIDQISIEQIGIPGLVLMERAARNRRNRKKIFTDKNRRT